LFLWPHCKECANLFEAHILKFISSVKYLSVSMKKSF